MSQFPSLKKVVLQLLSRWLTPRFKPGPCAVDRTNGKTVILYTRHGCHLCEDAQALLVRHGLKVEEVDIDADPALRARFTACVPVVVIDGVERFRGQVNEVLLRRLLRARS